jgi:hypothetical protein
MIRKVAIRGLRVESLSQIIYDELGLCWIFQLRPGNTKSGVGAPEQIAKAFSSYKFSDEKYLSVDAAYCNQEVIKTCISVGAKFTLTANDATTLWKDHIGEISNWESWVYTKDQFI